MESRTTRRALLEAAPAHTLTAAPAPLAHAENSDEALLHAFRQWRELHAQRNALPETACDEEAALWNVIDRVETKVHDLPATTPAGVACKLWIAIPHNDSSHEEEAAAFRADLDWFVARGDATDWSLRCIVSALVALKTMEARA